MKDKTIIAMLFIFSVVWPFATVEIARVPNENHITKLVEMITDSVVEISVESNGRIWYGSGVIVSEDGIILTAKHVVLDANKITVRLIDGTEYIAVSSKVVDDADAAMVKIDASGLKAARLGDSDNLIAGQYVIAIGHPFGLSYTVSLGIVSTVGREDDFFGDEDLIQSDVQTNPGNSGCPLFNLKGEVVGIVVGGIIGSDGISFSTPINVLKELVNAS